MSLPKLLVIVGPTASGKTALGVALAKRFDGEIASADSRQIYKGMDIGTAKPTVGQRKAVRHHLIDVVRPDQTLTLAGYKRKAIDSIRRIIKKGKLPILVGGTGLYVQALVDNFEIPEVPPDPRFRTALQKFTPDVIWGLLKKKDRAYAARVGRNPRYVIRALEVMRATGKTVTELQKKGPPLFDVLMIGLRPPKAVLEKRIAARTKLMAKRGLVDEARRLAGRHGWEPAAMSGIGYRELRGVLEGREALEDALSAIASHTRQYAKRQMTWFKRDKRIRWLSGQKPPFAMVKKWLK